MKVIVSESKLTHLEVLFYIYSVNSVIVFMGKKNDEIFIRHSTIDFYDLTRQSIHGVGLAVLYSHHLSKLITALYCQ